MNPKAHVEFSIARDPDTVGNFIEQKIKEFLTRGEPSRGEERFDYYREDGTLLAAGLRFTRSISKDDPFRLDIVLEFNPAWRMAKEISREDRIILAFHILSPVKAFEAQEEITDIFSPAGLAFQALEIKEVSVMAYLLKPVMDDPFHLTLVKAWLTYPSSRKDLGPYLESAAKTTSSDIWNPEWEKVKTTELSDTSSDGSTLSEATPTSTIPESARKREEWAQAYRTVLRMRQKYRDLLDDKEVGNPNPKYEDIRDALLEEGRRGYSDRHLRRIIRAGDDGRLKDI